MTRAALYARYSSENQREASIEDQFRLCREHAERQGWRIIESYSDHAVSGASLLRPGIQALLSDAGSGRFDIILSESLDRISRDQEDIAGVYKRMRFAGVQIATLSEGEISELHIGLKGTMGALYLKDLADKTRRGLRGRIEEGKSGGGNSYGYDIVRRSDSAGEPIHGERSVNHTEAQVIRRIFASYAAGKSPRGIAHELNAEGVSGPRGSQWGPSTIHGNLARGTGVLNNELYIGRLVWNRLRYLKNPDTGKRVSRLNPETEWISQDVPELRIVEQELWEKVKARQSEIKRRYQSSSNNALLPYRRNRHLFSGLIKCSCCGGGYSIVCRDELGCSTLRNKGTCENTLRIRHGEVEERILGTLRRKLMAPALFKEFCDEYTRELNRLRIEASAGLEAKRADVARVDRELKVLLQAIKAGGPIETIVEDMKQLEARKAGLEADLQNMKDPPALLHPNMALEYRRKLDALYDALQDEQTRLEAMEDIRSLVGRIVLTPNDEKLDVYLEGDLAGILSLASGKKSPAASGDGRVTLSVVAGVGFEPTTFRL